jgi:hypothetical protein
MPSAHFAAQQSKENDKVYLPEADLIPIPSPGEKGNHEDCSEAFSPIFAFISQFPRRPAPKH